MSIDLVATRLAMAEQLRTMSPDVMVYAEWPGTPQVYPCLVFMPPERVNYGATFGTNRPGRPKGMDVATWQLLALVGRPNPASQSILEGFMAGEGALSVIQCLYANRRLGGLVSNLRVTEVNSGMYVVTRTPNDDVIGCDITIEVMA